MTKGERIKALRKSKGITQEEMAKRLNTTKQAVSKYERGIVTNIPSDKIEALALALDSTPEYILGWTPAETEEKSDLIAEVVLKMRTDVNFYDAVASLHKAFSK